MMLEDRSQSATQSTEVDAQTASPNAATAQKASTQLKESSSADFLKPRHPSHALIARLPEACQNGTSTRYWYYGWPLNIDFVDAALLRFHPNYNLHNPVVLKVAEISVLLENAVGYPLQLVYVRPDENSPKPLRTTDPGVSFFMVVGTCGKRFYIRRPKQEQVSHLVRLWFGEEPRWMEDADETKEWHKYELE
ncbi:hypothetical protein BD626DRAFT_567986 [Schizophyllum amplum]|uniref:Uncharacterized protein n=1 Tax=Schizophyllum amplum TaxID=97359 RepID=A0A550CHC1_9AGAR|nr:hypothetical protein BD626DRAFT_567986 [Auriculariopsis ampla]